MVVPALPLEILQQIVDLFEDRDHEDHEDQHRRQDNHAEALPAKHSKTLLACHIVSKQFRACALRRISIARHPEASETPSRRDF